MLVRVHFYDHFSDEFVQIKEKKNVVPQNSEAEDGVWWMSFWKH